MGGFANKKDNFFTQVSALKSIFEGNLDSDFSLPSTKDIGQFLLGALMTMFGAIKVKEAIGEMIANMADKANEAAKESLNKQVGSLPNDKEIDDTDVQKIDVKSLDADGKLKDSLDSPSGKLNFINKPGLTNRKIKEALDAPGTEIDIVTATIEYDPEYEQILLKPKSGILASALLTGLVATLVLIDKDTLFANVMNAITGGVSKESNASTEDIITDLKMKKIINNMLNDVEDIVPTEADIRDINEKAANLKNGGTYVDLGCGLFDLDINIDDITDITNNVSGMDDPNDIVNEIDGLVKSKTNTDDGNVGNDDTIISGFYDRIYYAIKDTLVQSIVAAPQVKLILGAYGMLKDGQLIIDNVEYLLQNKNLINCLVKSMTEIMFEYMFNVIKEELLKIVIGASKKIILEKINQFTAQFFSLIYNV